MSESPEDVVRSMYDSFARGDVSAILSTVDEHIDWRSPANLPHGGRFAGRDGVGRFFEGIGDRWEALSVDVEELLTRGDRVVVLITARGRLRTGEESGYTAAHAWTLREAVPIAFAETVDAPLTLPAALATA